MGFRITENGVRKACALVLVGTMVGGVTYGRVVANSANRNDFIKGYYYDEDVKKNRADLMSSIELGGKAKTLEKRRDVMPKTIRR